MVGYWLRHCATSREVPGSIPGGVTGNYFRGTPDRTLRSTQLLKVSTRDFCWGKGGRCVWLTTYRPCSAETSRKSGTLIYPEPLWPTRPVAGNLYFTFYICAAFSFTIGYILVHSQPFITPKYFSPFFRS